MIRRNIRNLYNEYLSLKKEGKRETPAAVTKREVWKGDLQDVFDIASDKIAETNVPEEDLAFLEMQREDRQSCSMGSVDKVHASAVAKKADEIKKRKMRKKKHEAEVKKLFKKVPLEETSDSSSVFSGSSVSDEDFQGCRSPAKSPRRRRPSKNTMSPVLTTTWDRENLSCRQAAASFVATASSLGHDVLEISCSASTVHRMRRRNRETEAKRIEEEAFRDPPPLVLHWDGKLIQSAATSRISEERIAVVLTGTNFEELLGVPIAIDGTGREVAATVLRLLETYQIADKIIGLSFDTTASNSGMIRGACTIIEQSLERPLIWLACRHHIHEVVLKNTYELLFGSPPGPEIPLFKRFREKWDFLDRTSAGTLSDEQPLDEWSESQRQKMIDFLRRVIHDAAHPREDYLELLQLSLVYLGGWSGDVPRFRAPGVYHQARWMAKAIYILKIALFLQQMELTRSEESGVRRLARFVSLIYVRFWHEAAVPNCAPKNDLDFLAILQVFVDRELGSTAEKALRRHLWYLSEQGVALAFFDERVSPDDRAAMVKNLSRPATSKALKRLEKKNFTLPDGLSQLVTGRTLETIGVFAGSMVTTQNVEHVLQDPRTRATVRGLQVTNDAAERGVALIQRLQARTEDEQQKQFLLKVVHHDRKTVKRTKAGVTAKFPPAP